MNTPASVEPAFAAAAQRFLFGVQKLIDDDHAAHYPNIPRTVVSLEWGPRYVRVVADHSTQRSSWGFLDRTNGDVLKAESWKKPAKHARGNLFDEAGGLARVGPFGPAYLR